MEKSKNMEEKSPRAALFVESFFCRCVGVKNEDDSISAGRSSYRKICDRV